MGDPVEARVKFKIDLFDRQHADVGRQDRVQRSGERRGGQRRGEADRRHLAKRVHTGVGPARAMNHDIRSLNRCERVFQQSLNRGAGGLTLPADVVRAVVLQRDLQGAHRVYDAREPGLATGMSFAQSGQLSGW